MQANIYQQGHYLKTASRGASHKVASTAAMNACGKQKAASMGLVRVAGNYFESPCTHDLWQVVGDKISKLSKNEVDYEESVIAADKDDPKAFLANLMSELAF